MASPQESITTVSGRRCTRSRARTAVSSIFTTSEAAIVTSIEEAPTSTAVQIAPQILTSAAAQVEPPPQVLSSSEAPPPQSTAPAATTPAAVSSAIGTISAIPISPTQPPLLANVAPSVPVSVAPEASVEPVAPEAPAVPVEASSTPVAAIAVSQVVAVTPSPSPSENAALSTAIGSDAILTAVSSALRAQPSLPAPVFVTTAQSAVLVSSADAAPGQPSQTDPASIPSSTADTASADVPQPTATAVPSLPSGDSAAGIIAPGQGDSNESGLTIPSSGDANIGSIVGGVIGGVGGLALVCALLFFCLRKRKPREPKWMEKEEDGPGFVEKIKAIPAGVGALFVKIKGGKAVPARNSYRRHTPQDSISSIYSTTSNGRSRSISEPQGFFAAGAPGNRPSSRASRSSKKGDRNVLRKKNSSVSSQSTFAGIMAELDRDPFSDPEPPRTLLLLNPDPSQSPRGPVTPQPAATSAGIAKNPFASPFDDDKDSDIFILQRPTLGHKRTGSSASALSSNPPELFTPAPKINGNASIGPPPPTQAALPGSNRRSSMAYPAFNATSTVDSRDSYFGEPGPSRPGTSLFTPALPTGRTVRQSDPFDLDRPEVLGFGNVIGRREVRASVTRQGTINRRTSTAGNWATTTMDSQSSDRDSAMPRPLWSAGGRR